MTKLGAVLFYFIVIMVALALANFLATLVYEKSLLAVIKDFVFILMRK